MNTQELKDGLVNFYGTENYHFNPLYPWLKYTDGAKFFAENAGGGAYWFLDIIGTELRELTRKEDFLNIVLTSWDNKARILVDDGNDNALYSRDIDYTDCPAGSWQFYLVNDVLMLPSEY